MSVNVTLSPAMIERYLRRRVEDLSVCKVELAHYRTEAIELIGHRLKGSAESFGFPELAQLGIQLEKEAKEGAFDSLRSLVESLESWVVAHSHPASSE